MHDFATRLIAWQRAHGRHHLPWQGADPYRVWISEIMLQQTQVETVLPYYQRFISRFPNLESLAHAEEDAVLAAWSGLGYYARARNLRHAAQRIMTEHGGRIPDEVAELRALPGIGRTTAAAIAALAFGKRAAILDGNVKRVLCRVFGIEGWPGVPAVERQLWTLAETLLPNDTTEIAAYTQGLMDLGASVCRRRPACAHCPFEHDCVARREGRTQDLPEPRPSRRLPTKNTAYTVLLHAHTALLQKRPPYGIWGGLWSLPECAPTLCAEEHAARLGYRARLIATPAPIEHTFSHFKLSIQPRICRLIAPIAPIARCEKANRLWLPLDKLAHTALPAPVRRILQAWRDNPMHEDQARTSTCCPR